MHGAALIPRLGAVRIRSDVQRKRLAGRSAETKTESAAAARMYDAAMTERTYERLKDLAGIVSGCGIPVIVDATFLARARREKVRGAGAISGRAVADLGFSGRRSDLAGADPFSNIKKYLMYLLSSNIGEIGLMVGATLAGLPLPLSAVQILDVNLATDGLPALALAVDPAEPDAMRRPPRDPSAGISAGPWCF